MKNMDRDKFMLAAMSPAGTGFFTPVQVQKMFFLFDKNISDKLRGEFFNFTPYDYGPFDVDVYRELEELENEGLVEIQDLYPTLSPKRYRLTDDGLSVGAEIFKSFDDFIQKYILDVVEFVRSMSFAELVAAIYEFYPEMAVNSTFKRRS